MTDYFDVYVAACVVGAFFVLIFLADRIIDGPRLKQRARERSMNKANCDIDREADALMEQARQMVEDRERVKQGAQIIGGKLY